MDRTPVLSVFERCEPPKTGYHRRAGAVRVLGLRRYLGLEQSYLCRLGSGEEVYLPCTDVTIADNLVAFGRRPPAHA